MLTQQEVVKYLSNPHVAQHEAFQIIAAYIYCKSSRGNLPTETLAKILSIQRKIIVKGVSIPPTSPVGRAFEAAKTQLIAANRKWISLGPRALGPLGEIGSASSPDARSAWTKATDGKITTFDDGTRGGIAIDAGRVVGPAAPITEAPPMYEPPPEDQPLTRESNAPMTPAVELDRRLGEPEAESNAGTNGSAPTTTATTRLSEADRQVAEVAETIPPPVEQPAGKGEGGGTVDFEAGRAHLAKLRAELLAKQAAEDEAKATSTST